MEARLSERLSPRQKLPPEESGMSDRTMSKEIIQGLEEFKAWKRGEVMLRTIDVGMPPRPDVKKKAKRKKALGR